MDTAQARPRCDHRKMPSVKQQGLLAVVTLRGRASTPDERTLLFADSPQPDMHGKLAVVYGDAKRVPQTYSFDDVSRVMYRCYERSERSCGSVQHLQEFTDATQ